MAYGYDKYSPGLEGPYVDEVTVVPSDTADLDPPRALRFDGPGTVRYTTLRGGAPRDMTVAEGDHLYVMVRRVHATGTTVTAGNIVALY